MSGPAHRSISNIRPSITGLQGTPGSPQTPTRLTSSSYGSPSALRAEEESVVIELGSRFLRAGLAGDAVPRAVIAFGPSQQRRAGDFRHFQARSSAGFSDISKGQEWGHNHSLWNIDLRKTDLALVGDRLERAMKDAFTKFLLIDSRPRKIALALPTGISNPLLSAILNTLFNVLQAPSISLLSSPVLVTAAAGLRAALVVDIGWAETTATVIYEYREVLCRRSVRAAKLLSLEFYKMLTASINSSSPRETRLNEENSEAEGAAIPSFPSFEEVEEIMERLAWCRGAEEFDDAKSTEALPAVKEEEELETKLQHLAIDRNLDNAVAIPLVSIVPPRTVNISLRALAEPCETTLLGDCDEDERWDDEELPLHQLIYKSLLDVPVDVRSVCMSRIVFSGGVSNTPGLKSRVLAELRNMIEQRSWSPIVGKALFQYLSNTKLRRSSQASKSLSTVANTLDGGTTEQGKDRTKIVVATNADGERSQMEVRSDSGLDVRSVPRAVDSLSAWTGASLLSHLRLPAVSVIEREHWLQYGATGISRAGEAAITNTRQSMGSVALTKTGIGERPGWTLGAWA